MGLSLRPFCLCVFLCTALWVRGGGECGVFGGVCVGARVLPTILSVPRFEPEFWCFGHSQLSAKQNKTKTKLSPIIILEACKHIARAHAAVRKWMLREPNGHDRDWEAAASAVRLRMFSGKERPVRYSL